MTIYQHIREFFSELFAKPLEVPCLVCFSPIPMNKNTKAFSVHTNQGQAILLLCPTCGRPQRPLVIENKKVRFLDCTDEEMEEIYEAFKARPKSN